MENQKQDENIQDVNEWMEHQYDPGHYLGGNVPPAYKNPANKKAMGLLLLIMGLGVGIIYTIIFIKALSEMNEKIGLISFSIFAYSIFVLQIIGGIRTLSKTYTVKQKEKIKKWIFFSTIIIIVAVSISMWIISQFKSTVSIEITSINQFKIRQIKFKDYIYLEDKELNCDKESSNILRCYKAVPKDNVKYIITYQYYEFNPKKGKVIKVEEIREE
ncbi:hypothetical protein [Vallitalea guaymasensis]|uniref:hypothetical protein n=1 Tax=Vallitalea guaymasensis TaxID=1185412 RepID=UPI0023568BF3|nr:hypothetical protein [Vallitalea guaymasensis]